MVQFLVKNGDFFGVTLQIKINSIHRMEKWVMYSFFIQQECQLKVIIAKETINFALCAVLGVLEDRELENFSFFSWFKL